jgi:uncharacterized protein (DUF952 family)
MTAIFKIVTADDWAQARASGAYRGSPDDARDGFIHFSTAAQVRGTLARHFAGRTDLMLLEFIAEELGPALKWEATRGGQLFPHFYGPFPVGGVHRSGPIGDEGYDGRTLPTWFEN